MSGQTELLPRGAELIKKVQVDKVVARELGFESGQKKLLPRCAGKTAAESDKITCGKGYWAPDSIVPGVRSTSHQEHGQVEGDGQVLGDIKVVQSQELPLTDSFIAGRYKPFQSIKVFWQGLCGELKGVHDHHQHQEASHNQEQDQALSVEEDQPPVQTDPAGGEGLLRQGHSMEGGDGHEEQAGGDGDGLQQLADHRARVGDGFQTEFRKISRARRKRKALPDGQVQMLLSNFVVSGQNQILVGGGQSTTLLERKRKVEPEPVTGEFKKFRDYEHRSDGVHPT